jgi:NAD dependent epimerase/dehydratase family enzyme
MRDYPIVLGRLLHRPALLPTPAFALRVAFGELADVLLLASQRLAPERALNTGYAFRFQTLEDAFRDILRRR